MFFGTLLGLNCYDGRQFRTYRQDDGLAAADLNRGASAVDWQGRLWFGSTEGLTVFDPAIEAFPANGPRVHITRASMIGPDSSFSDGAVLKYFENDLNARGIVEDTFEGIDRIKILVKRVLDFTKTGTPAFTSGDIHESINDALALITPQIKKRNIEVKKDFAAHIGPFVFDPHQMQQVFVNILLNATEATPDGGIIEIRSAKEKSRNGGSDTYVISITDNGPGIPPDNITKIFDPFFTTKPEGTGLGLSIVHKILEQHDATIDIKSRENKGASFILRFPVKRALNKHANI